MNIKQFEKALLYFCKQNDIKAYTYESASRALEACGLSSLAEEAPALCLRNRPRPSSQATDYIFYEKGCSRESRTYSICQELGHILLGHLDGNTKLSVDKKEAEANIFASVLMAQLVFSSILELDNLERQALP